MAKKYNIMQVSTDVRGNFHQVDNQSMPKSMGKKGPSALPGMPVRVTAASHSCVAEATAPARQSNGDADKVVQVQDQSNFEVCPICLEPIVKPLTKWRTTTLSSVKVHDGCRA